MKKTRTARSKVVTGNAVIRAYSKSKTDWHHAFETGPGFEATNCGSLARIVDAVELMSKSYIGLLDRVKRQEESIEGLRKRNAKLENRARGLRGALTRKKRGPAR